jgi:hypothetical protein
MMQCYRCQKELRAQQEWILGHHAKTTGWHRINLMIGACAASGPQWVSVCDECDPPPVIIPRTGPVTPEMVEWAESVIARAVKPEITQ